MFSKLTSPFAGLIFGLFCLLNNAAIAQKQPATIVGWDFQKNKAVLETAPRRSADATGIAFQIPLPDGEFHAATVLVSPILTNEAAAQLPDIQSYLVQGDGFHGRINTTPQGFFGYLLTREGSVLIQSDGSPNRYRVSKSDPSELRNFECSALRDQNLDDNAGEKQRGLLNISNGATLRTYHIAIVCTDEFEAANANPTLTATNTMTAINVIYESELAVHFDIAGIALENGTYNINTGGGASAYEAVKAVSAYFTNSASYDLGHVFHSPAGGGAGQAYLGAVCRNTSVGNPPVSPIKAGGWSGASDNNATWWYAILAHEIGHMFDAEHTFNGTASSCGGGNINAATSYEPGSGTTLMSYSGSCGTDNILIPGGTDPISQADTDDSHFHSTSLTDMITYFTSGNGSGCSTNTATGNTPPVGNANPGSQSNITIPKQTPFTLIGSATDANGDQLTYSWEQANPGPPHGSPGIAANSASGPIFRTYPQTTSPTRTFPALSYILNNANVVPNANLGEVLPGVARTLNFNFLVRDNRAGGGGTHCSPLTVTVSNNGPLAVTSPNTAISWAAGSTQAVTWNVNGTNNISTCANVNILLSINGGQSFPYVLVANTTNDGSQNVTIPTTVPATTQARIRVECNTGNVYIVPFDLSNVNFTITNGSCSAAPSAICPDVALTAPSGSNDLNFSFENYVPSPTTSKTFAVSASDPLMTRCRWNNAVTACMTPGGTTNYQTFRFIVSQSGTYTFSFGSGNFRAAHLFANTFDPNNPCATFVASSVRDGAGYYTAIVSNTSGSPSIPLLACTEYFLVVVTEGFGGNTTVTFGGTGSIHELFTSPGGYDYTYVAVNQATDQVAAVSPTASFSGLGGGTYCVSGLSYLNSLNPNDFVGQSVATMLTNCVQLSANCKPVTVTGGSGCTPPNITDQPDALTVCAGQSASFSVTATTGSGSLTYQWRKNGNNISGATAATYTINNTTTGDAGTYSVVVSNAVNCSSTSTGAVLTVNTAPTAGIGGDFSICTGESTTLTAVGGTSYLWNTGATTPSITVNPTANTTYTVTATNAAGCTDTESATVSVSNIPVASISGNVNICAGTSTTLTAGGGTSYLWNTGATTASITVSPTSNTTYTVTATNAAGCSDTESTTVAVGAAPTATISGNSSICAGSSTTLTASGGTSYAWNTGATTAAITVSPTANTTYTVTATNAAGCTDTENITVAVSNLPTATISGNLSICGGGSTTLTASGGTSYFWNTGATTAAITVSPTVTTIYTVTVTNAGGCTATKSATVSIGGGVIVKFSPTKPTCFGGTNGKLKATGSGSTAPYTYAWNTGSTAQQLLNIPAGTYTVTVTSASGCSLAATYTLTQPTAVAIKGTVTQILCNNQNNGKIVATASGGTGAKTLLWNTGATTGTIQNLAGGTYTITATDTKGCTGSATFTIVNPTPVSLALVSIVPASGGKWKVNLQGSGGTPFSATILHKYNYRLNGNTAWALTNWTGNKSFTLLPGVYDFGVRDKNNCEAIITVSVPTIAIAPPPIGDAFAREASATVKISPNPTSGLFNLEMQDLPFAPVSVEVFDLTGRQIRATNFDGDGAPATNQFDLRAEPAGVYFIRVSTEGFSKTLRLVKQ